jgi:hypothetical protein
MDVTDGLWRQRTSSSPPAGLEHPGVEGVQPSRRQALKLDRPEGGGDMGIESSSAQ